MYVERLYCRRELIIRKLKIIKSPLEVIYTHTHGIINDI